MLDTQAPIEPGRGLGGIAVGTSLTEILENHTPLQVFEIPGDEADPDGVTIHSFGAIRTWSVKGEVVQVGAFEGYTGKTAEGVGVGSTVADLGEVVPEGGPGFLALPGTPGIGLETTEWSTGDTPDPDATVVQIYVHAAED